MFPNIQIFSLTAAREADLSIYDGIITIENSTIEDPLRVDCSPPEQLVLRFDDICEPIDDFIEPQAIHVQRALLFADRIGDGSLLVHCHAGISRSSAIGLAIIAKKLGTGKELESVEMLEKINPYSYPNKSLVLMTDEILDRNMKLYKMVSDKMTFTEKTIF